MATPEGWGRIAPRQPGDAARGCAEQTKPRPVRGGRRCARLARVPYGLTFLTIPAPSAASEPAAPHPGSPQRYNHHHTLLLPEPRLPGAELLEWVRRLTPHAGHPLNRATALGLR